ncbi:MAG: mechanosensitive ion channel family protein [Acidobacteriota bacterium]|nr:mechanosensitive ion channel family protein [Acidobacteriota bacterium]
MSFWHHVQMAAGRLDLYWLVPVFLLAVVALFVYVPAERSRLRSSVYLFALALIGLFAAALVGAERAVAYRWVSWAALFMLGVAIINVASVLVFNVMMEAVRLKPPRIARDLLVALAYIVLGIALLSAAKVDLTGIVATSAVITAVIGFSLQDTLGNVMGGMALQMERTISVGDWIRVGTDEGQVKEIRWRQTSIETRNWDTIVIPNSVLMRSQVTLLGHRVGAPRQQRRWIYFNVDFRYAPSEVIAAVEAALCAEPIDKVAPDPAPHCLLIDFKDSYATYAARYWITDLAPTDPVDGVVRARLFYALRRVGIPLSMPARALFITEDDEARRDRKRREEIEARAAALRGVELFHPLTEDERRVLAERISDALFVKGEAITRQGAEAHWLYIIRKGEAEVRVKVQDGELTERVAILGVGNFFGEMGLLTGEPRAATVIALTDVECYRVNKEIFQEGLRQRPEIAQDISNILARRRVELDSVVGQLNADAMRQRMQNLHGDFLNRIRNFFSLDGHK